MTDDTKKDDVETAEIVQKMEGLEITPGDENMFLEILDGWHTFVNWLKKQNNPEIILKCMYTEINNKARSHFIDRLRTRYNKQRALYDLRILERYVGQIISINHIGKRR